MRIARVTQARFVVLGALLVVAGTLGAASVSAGSTGTRKCQTSDFKLSRGPSDAALGHYRDTVKLRNTTSSTCTVSGWFRVKLLDAKGHVLPSKEKRITQDYFGKSPKPTVKVKPGGSASFAIDTLAPTTTCPYSKWVAVTAPGGTGSKRLALKVLACKKFSVLPVQPDNKAIHP